MKSSVFLTLALSFLYSTVTIVNGSSYGFGPQSEEETNPSWPTKMTFGETKTNYMLGSALLKRVYKRMDHSDSLMKSEINQMYEKLRDEIQRSLRQKCDGTRKPDTTTTRGQSETSQHQTYSSERQPKQQDKQARGTKDKDKGKKKDTKRQNGQGKEQGQGTHQKYYD